MEVIDRELEDKRNLTETFIGLKLRLQAAKLPIGRKNSVYVTLSKLRKKGFEFETLIESESILVWRTL